MRTGTRKELEENFASRISNTNFHRSSAKIWNAAPASVKNAVSISIHAAKKEIKKYSATIPI
jgi:hypothetical protein